jgi:cobalt-precorrin 5A hydrolase
MMDNIDKCAVITLSREGLNTAHRIKNNFEVDIYTLEKYIISDEKPIIHSLEAFNKFLFKEYETLIYIMATGIVVRVIAPYIEHKSVDPAVIVMDGKGQYVISLLSGHLGGANEKTRQLAKKIGGQAVITTTSDVLGKTAVDTLALALDCSIDSLKNAKEVTAAIIDQKKIAMRLDAYINLDNVNLSDNIVLEKEESQDILASIIVTNKNVVKKESQDVVLFTKNIVLGMGCRKGTSFEDIEKYVLEKLKSYNISSKSIIKVATIDIKKNEPGLIEFCQKYKANFTTYTAQEMEKYENLFVKSDFVKKTVGVSSVCEISGYMASNMGRKISEKECKDGMTLSIWEEKKCYTL